MNLVLEHINPLPMRTWFALKINDTRLEASVADSSPYQGEPLASPLPDGVSVFQGALPEIETGMGQEAVAFVQENQNCGASLRIAAGTKVSRPVFLSYRIDADNPTVVDSTAILAEAGSEVTVVASYTSDKKTAGFHGGLTKVYAEKGAVVHLVLVQLLGERCLTFNNVGALADEGARVDLIQAELGGQRALAGCKALLAGTEAALDLNAIYFGDRSRQLDFNYIAEHQGRRTHTEIHVSGALLDESSKTFRGTIDFKKGAKHAVGHESEYNLLFSPKVHNVTAPLILCAEEDVEGQHAASTGKIDEAKLFYLMSRGLSEPETKKLMIEAQFQPVTDRIPDAALRAAISAYVKERLDAIDSLP